MALVKLGHVVGAISGTLQSVNYAQTRNGTVARSALRRTNKRTKAQLDQRAAFARTGKQWLELTDAERLAWSKSASGFKFQNRLGMPYSLNGLGLFRKIMLTPTAVPWPDNTVPPVMERTKAPIVDWFIVEVGPPAFYWINWDDPPTPSGGSVLAYVSRPFSEGAINVYNYWFGPLVQTPKWGSMEVQDEVTAHWGNCVVGERYAALVSFWDPPLLPSLATTFYSVAQS